MVDLPRHFVEIQHYLNKIHKPFVESSTLEKLVEQTLYGDFFVNRVFQCMSFPPPFPVRSATPSPGSSEGVAVSIPSFFLLSQSPGPV